nr:MAG TPA: hypothetical protein [Caudoviricetes sp.]
MYRELAIVLFSIRPHSTHKFNIMCYNIVRGDEI